VTPIPAKPTVWKAFEEKIERLERSKKAGNAKPDKDTQRSFFIGNAKWF
jgi:hypothetical protein